MTPALPGTAAGRTTLVVALLGLAVSVYLTVEHYSSSTSLACPATGALDCVKVTTSSWSVIAGVPVAVLGLVFFTGMTALSVLGGRLAADLRVAAAVVGALMVLWLVYVELFLVDAVCVWCTGVHLLTLVLLGTTIWWRESERSAPSTADTRVGRR
ncbi:vitamin K epoxide reductase family protein [Jatrophihabitans sp. YIM 134969]